MVARCCCSIRGRTSRHMAGTGRLAIVTPALCRVGRSARTASSTITSRCISTSIHRRGPVVQSSRDDCRSSCAQRVLTGKVRRLSQTQWVVVATILGVAVGLLFPDSKAAGFHATDIEVLSNIFLRLIKSMIAPLIFSTLVVGIAGHGDDLRRVGKLAFRSLLYFEIATTLALIVGLVVVNVVQPGRGVNLPAVSAAAPDIPQAKLTASSMLEHAVPQSFVDAAARNDSLQIVVFTILFAIGLSQVNGPVRFVILNFCESLAEAMFKVVGVVMRLAPVGIGAAIAVTVGRNGLGVLRSLGLLVLSLYGSLALFALFVLLPIALVGGVPIRRFVAAIKEPWLLAFTTASSEA